VNFIVLWRSYKVDLKEMVIIFQERVKIEELAEEEDVFRKKTVEVL